MFISSILVCAQECTMQIVFFGLRNSGDFQDRWPNIDLVIYHFRKPRKVGVESSYVVSSFLGETRRIFLTKMALWWVL